MDNAITPIRQSEDCDIGQAAHYVRGIVGPGLAHEVQECYRALVNECLQRRSKRLLIVGKSGGDAFIHLAVRDSIRAMALAGLPPGFRAAFVAANPEMIAVYDAAVVEAQRHGIDARRFFDEGAADQWLES